MDEVNIFGEEEEEPQELFPDVGSNHKKLDSNLFVNDSKATGKFHHYISNSTFVLYLVGMFLTFVFQKSGKAHHHTTLPY